MLTAGANIFSASAVHAVLRVGGAVRTEVRYVDMYLSCPHVSADTFEFGDVVGHHGHDAVGQIAHRCHSLSVGMVVIYIIQLYINIVN